MHFRIGVELLDELQQRGLGGVLREIVLPGADAQLLTGPGLVADIHLAAHIISHQHHCQSRNDPLFCKLCHLPAQPLPGLLGHQFSV